MFLVLLVWTIFKCVEERCIGDKAWVCAQSPTLKNHWFERPNQIKKQTVSTHVYIMGRNLRSELCCFHKNELIYSECYMTARMNKT